MTKPQTNRYFVKAFYDFCMSTSVSGYKNIVANDQTTFFEKILWGCVNLAVFIFSLVIFGTSLVKISENPTAVTLDNQSYNTEMLYFPGIALCNINQMSRKKVYEYATYLAKKKMGENAKKGTIDWYADNLKDLGQLLVFNSDSTPEMIDFQVELDHLDPDPVTGFWNGEKAMEFMAPNCEEHIFSVKYNGEPLNTNESFYLMKADEGYCCMFNYLRPPYAKYNEGFYQGNITFPVKVGLSNGLQFLVVNNISDYFYPTMNIVGFQLLTFNPFEYPDALMGNYRRDILEMGERSYFEVETTVHRANRDIGRFSKHKRGCVFREEEYKYYKGNYKFSECLLKCRMEAIKALCECLPYFVPMNFKDVATNTTVICSLHHLNCLFKYQLKFRSWAPLMTDKEDIPGLERELLDGMSCPDCYPDCAYTRYTLSSAFVALKELPDSAKRLKNTSIMREESNVVRIYYRKQHTSIYYTDLVYSWAEMLSVFGALLSIIFGFSLVSLLEIFYFGIWRTFQYYCDSFHENEEDEEEMKVDVNSYKSIEQALLKISMRKNLFPLPERYEFLRDEIKPRKPIKAWRKL